jgi:hypothetical protein
MLSVPDNVTHGVAVHSVLLSVAKSPASRTCPAAQVLHSCSETCSFSRHLMMSQVVSVLLAGSPAALVLPIVHCTHALPET